MLKRKCLVMLVIFLLTFAWSTVPASEDIPVTKEHPEKGHYEKEGISYLKSGSRISLSTIPSAEIYWRYVKGGKEYPSGPNEDYYYYQGKWWYPYDKEVGICFFEECPHILYYFAKESDKHGTIYCQSYLVDGSKPSIVKKKVEEGIC
jgi:hypothetical protein